MLQFAPNTKYCIMEVAGCSFLKCFAQIVMFKVPVRKDALIIKRFKNIKNSQKYISGRKEKQIFCNESDIFIFFSFL